MLSFDQLPPLTKAAVQTIRDMYRREYKSWSSLMDGICSDRDAVLYPEDRIWSVGVCRAPVKWFKYIKGFNLLTPEIIEELIPHLLAGNGE